MYQKVSGAENALRARQNKQHNFKVTYDTHNQMFDDMYAQPKIVSLGEVAQEPAQKQSIHSVQLRHSGQQGDYSTTATQLARDQKKIGFNPYEF